VHGPLLREQPREERVQPVHDAHEVDIDEPVPVRKCRIDHGTGVTDTRVVEQQVDRAALEDAVGEAGHGLGIGHVDRVGHGVTAGRTHLPGDGLGARTVQIGDVHHSAALTEQLRYRPADARARAGHDGGLAGEVAGVDVRRAAASTRGAVHA